TELPASGVALVFTKRAILALDAAGHFTRVRGQWRVDGERVSDAIRIPEREEMFFVAPNGPFLVRDEAATGAGSCAAAELHVPEQNVCLASFDDPKLGIAGAIDGVVDSAAKDAPLVSTDRGTFRIDALANVARYPPMAYGRVDLLLPWGEFLIRTAEGFDIVTNDERHENLVVDARFDTQPGTFRLVGFAPKARMAVFSVSNQGIYVLGPDRKIARLSGAAVVTSPTPWINSIAEVPWADRPVVQGSGRLGLLQFDRTIGALLDGAAPQFHERIRSWEKRVHLMEPVPRFGAMLVSLHVAGWGFVTSGAELRVLPQVPNGARLIAVRDLGEGDVFAIFAEGLWRVSANGEARAVMRTEVSRIGAVRRSVGQVADVARLPTTDEFVIGSTTGLSLSDDRSLSSIAGADANEVGAVRKITPLDWLDALLVLA